MKILKIIGIALLSLIVIAVIAVSVMSPKAHLERSIVVNAPPASVFQQISSFEKFNAWSPWAKMDPEAKQTFEGPSTGVGAKMSWEGEKSGKGSQWVVEYEENKRIKNALAFDQMEGTIFAEFILEEVPEGTKVTWTYDSDVAGTSFGNASMAKFFNAFMMGAMGTQYEEGLNNLKQIAESQSAVQPEPVAADSTVAQPQ